ncbi:MAG: hypothetical protein V4678_02225 [Patescibacteria group bacterium]
MKHKTSPSMGKRIKSFIVNHAHHALMIILLAFIGAAVLLGEMLNAYDKFWWWDDMLHGSSGLIFGLIGLFIMFAVNKRTDMRINAFFVALFVACFAMAMGVLWEIYEFSLDVAFKTTMQQWNMGSNAIVIGKDYQGMGLRDTMSDLITATIGALVASGISFYAFSRKRHTVRHVMRQAFPTVR